MAQEGGTTIREFLQFLSPSLAKSEEPPRWPPDAFGLCAALLFESGAYLRVFSQWPWPGSPADGFLDFKLDPPDSWAKRLYKIGKDWRASWPKGKLPDEISHWWRKIRLHLDVPLTQIEKEEGLYCALLQMLAAADEASYDVGVPQPRKKQERDPFGLEAEKTLLPKRQTGSSLCQEIDSSKLRVLPKFHTPQNGMSLQSLSLHLALWTGSDVTPLWFTADLPRLTDSGSTDDEESHSLNLLLIPWPEVVSPRQFVPVHPPYGRILNMPRQNFGFFDYRPKSDPERKVERLSAIYEAALELTDRIDGVVFPELALDEEEYAAIRRFVADHKTFFLIAGVGTPSVKDQPGRNRVRIEIPKGIVNPTSTTTRPSEMSTDGNPDGESLGHLIPSFQDKHHRWRLDRSQIVQYGLGGQLDPAKSWWEHMDARARHLTFVSLQPWLSLCALVCEDLARQEPVARLVRAVGPNLVVALLMDGPQLPSRWPARYATVLADDPGSSVLSFTSIGMCEFSRPPGKGVSRTVALWKDARSGEAVPIDLPPGADAIVLNLVRHWGEEWTGDGRSDEGAAGYPALAGIHAVRARPKED